jgi:hypothetical protein
MVRKVDIIEDMQGRKRWMMLGLLLVLTGCRGVVGLSDTPEGLANEFLRRLYALEFESIPNLAQGQALSQAALLEGAADTFSPEDRNRYLQSSFIINSFVLADGGNQASASYSLHFSDGSSLNNTIQLKKEANRWWVYHFTSPIIAPQIYQYFTLQP